MAFQKMNMVDSNLTYCAVLRVYEFKKCNCPLKYSIFTFELGYYILLTRSYWLYSSMLLDNIYFNFWPNWRYECER